MGVISMSKHLIWQMQQCAHILILIIHFHTGNVYCSSVPTVLVLIFITNKKILKNRKQHPQLGFTLITSLDVVLLMLEFHLNTRKYVTCVNKNLYQKYPQKYTPEKS